MAILAGLVVILYRLWKQAGAGGKQWRYVIYGSMATAWLLLAVVLMSSWIKGDDWRNIAEGNIPLGQSLRHAAYYYFSFVSRLGDFIVILFGQSRLMWQNYILIPLMAAVAPIAFHRLCKKEGETIYSWKGFLFYWFVLCLCLVGVYTKSWRNYWCWSAALNYLFPSLVAVYLASHYRMDELGKRGDSKTCAVLFVCGVIAGWGTECLSVMLCGLIGLWGILTYRGKLPKWGISRCCGVLGVLLGAVMLFASPALQNRSNVAREQMQLDITTLSGEEVHSFLGNLSWDSLGQLQGAGGVIFLGDFSLFDKLYFLPFVFERFWECCFRSAIVIFILLIIYLFILRNGKGGKCSWMIIWGGILFTCTMAASYTYSCIPWHMSFLPPCFVLVAVAAYLFNRLENRYILSLLALLITGYTILLIMPPTIEAWKYKKFELARFDYIDEQKALGNLDIVLPYPCANEPEDELGLIRPGMVSESPNRYPNSTMAKALKVRSIIQKKREKE